MQLQTPSWSLIDWSGKDRPKPQGKWEESKCKHDAYCVNQDQRKDNQSQRKLNSRGEVNRMMRGSTRRRATPELKSDPTFQVQRATLGFNNQFELKLPMQRQTSKGGMTSSQNASYHQARSPLGGSISRDTLRSWLTGLLRSQVVKSYLVLATGQGNQSKIMVRAGITVWFGYSTLRKHDQQMIGNLSPAPYPSTCRSRRVWLEPLGAVHGSAFDDLPFIVTFRYPTVNHKISTMVPQCSFWM